MSEEEEPQPLTERIAYLESVAHQANAQRPEPAPFHCRCGDMKGWVFTDEKTNTVRPCESCRPDAYARWESGAWLPDHLKRIQRQAPKERERRDTA